MRDSEKTEIRAKEIFSQTYRRISAPPSGFTIIELLMVIVLLGILAVSVVPKFVDTSGFSLEGAASMVVADLRYTQELAMSSHDAKKVEFTQNSSTYTLKNSDESVVKTVELPSGVSVSSSDITFSFNSLGEPTTGGGSSVTLSAGSQTKTVAVESYTGRVSTS
jgi:prepilin-type N-terminal cleavage/methylation domain-containing protein